MAQNTNNPFELFNRLGITQRAPTNLNPIMGMTGNMPFLLSNFGDNIYLSSAVVQATNCIVDEISKVRGIHIRGSDETNEVIQDSDISRILTHPNKWMTQSDFLQKVAYSLLANLNAYIIPTWRFNRQPDGSETRTLTGLYPIKPSNVSIQETPDTRQYITFRFMSGYETTIPYENVIHIREEFNLNDWFGGDRFGIPDHRGLKQLLQVNDSLITGVQKAMESSYAMNAIVKYNSMLDDGKLESNVTNFESQLQSNKSGILMTDIKSDVIPLKRDVRMVDPETVKYVDTLIL